MSGERNKILFITLGDQTGANMHIVKVANALKQQGHQVQVLVCDKSIEDPIVHQLPARTGFVAELGRVVENGNKTLLDRDLKYLFNTINEDNSYQDTEIILQHLQFNPQIIFVGITFDFLTSTDILKLSEATLAKVYNIAVDMNHFTGGCHFAWDCKGYIEGCHKVKCPAILDEKYKDLAARNFLIKKENAAKGNVKILAGTNWTKAQAAASDIYKQQESIFNIAGVIDTRVLNSEKRAIAKQIFRLAQNKFYILAGAENALDERKGFRYFVETINLFWEKLLPEERENVEVLTVTRIQNAALFDAIKFSKLSFDYIEDEHQLSLLYQSADAFINCSIEDSGPSMLIEAMACGTPVASFDMGAAAEYIVDGQSGYIVKNKNTDDLANAVVKIYQSTTAERLLMGEAGQVQVLRKGSLQQAVATIEQVLLLHKKEFEQHIKTISVAMCTYNGASHLAEQLDSILHQHKRPNEVVICDDQSTDGTIEIIKYYQSQFPGIIKLYINEQRLGVVKNFEKAIKLCSQEIIFLSDQDDIWQPYKTDALLRIFNKYPHIEAISHNLNICTEEKEILTATMWDTMGFQYFLKQKYANVDYFFHSLLFGNMVTGAAFCMRKPKQAISFIDHIPETIHDYQLAVRYLANASLYFHNECLGLYRQHHNQQIGADLQSIEHCIEPIKLYYQSANPFINLFFIKRRMEIRYIFQYLEATKSKMYEALVRKNVQEMALKTFRPKLWKSQVNLMSKIFEKTRGDYNYKVWSATLSRYFWFARSIIIRLFQILRIYFVLLLCTIFFKKSSIYRLLASKRELGKLI